MSGRESKIIAAVDIGAGRGAKMGVARVEGQHKQWLGNAFLAKRFYGKSVEELAQSLSVMLNSLLTSNGIGISELYALGIDMPGLFDTSHRILSCENIPFLTGTDLRSVLQNKLKIPVFISNDGKSGAIGEWSIHQGELIYWVFGGGWGGAWIEADGSVKFTAQNHPTSVKDLYCTNEPGYSIQIPIQELKPIFAQYGASFDRFRENYFDELDGDQELSKQSNSIRAEVLVSGVGCWRLFHALVTPKEQEQFGEVFSSKLQRSDTAGPVLHELAKAGFKSARDTYSLFGRLLGEVAVTILNRAQKDGAPSDIPIFLGGKLGKSYRFFATETQQIINSNGFKSFIHPSHFLKTGLNANLEGVLHLVLKYLAKRSHSLVSEVC